MEHHSSVVLLVDGHDPSRLRNSAILRRAGFDVIESRRPTVPLEFVRTMRPHIVVMRVERRERDGWLTFVEATKSDPRTRHIPILLITIDPTSEDLDLAINHRAFLIAIRPSDSTRRVAAVTSVLAVKRAESSPPGDPRRAAG
jgi:response regulator RpfG family c-di-GMP phosphodiesterase